MAISFVAAGTVATGANPTVAVPTGYALDDFLILVVSNSATTPTTPTGWTSIAAQGTAMFVTVFYKFAAASESSVTLANSSATATKAVMLAYRGVGLNDVVGSFTTTAGSTTLATATQTTLLANDYVISIYGNQAGGARTWTAPGSTTSRVNSSTTSTVNGMLIVDEAKATAGLTTARTATISASSQMAAIAISIRQPQTLYWRGGGTQTWNTTTKTPWSLTSGGTGGVAVPNKLDNVIFNTLSNTGTTAFTVTLSNAFCNNFTIDGANPLDANMTLAGGTSSLFIYGSLDWSGDGGLLLWTGTPTITFGATATGETIAWGSSYIVNASIVFDGIGGEWTTGSYLYGDTSTVTLTNGSLVLTLAGTLQVKSFSSSNSNTRSLTFGTSANVTLVPSSSSTPIDFTTITNLTIVGSPLFYISPQSTGFALTIQSNASFTETTAPSVYVYTYGGSLTFNGAFKDLTLTTGSAVAYTVANTAITIYGNFDNQDTTYPTFTAGTNAWTFAATSGTKTITSNGKTLDFPITFNGIGGTWQLQDALTVGSTRTVTLTNGTLNLNNNNLTCGVFLSNTAANTRALAFGTGQIYLTGNNASIWRTDDVSNMTITGTNPTINATYSGATGTRTLIHANASGTYTKAVNLNVTAGTDIIASSSGASMWKNVDFTGYSGAATFGSYVTGNLKLSSTMTNSTALTTTLINTSGTQQITSNGVTYDAPINIGYTIASSGASGDGTTATITFASSTNLLFPVGSTVYVTGITPTGYNGTYTVTASTLTSVSYANTTTGAQTVAGRIGTGNSTIQLQDALTVGSTRAVAQGTCFLALQTFNFTAGTFSGGSFAYPRGITTTGGAFYITGSSATVWNVPYDTTATLTGTLNVYCTYSGSVGTRAITGTTDNTKLINFYITAGTDTVTLTATRNYRTVDFTGFGGVFGYAGTASALNIYGNFAAPSVAGGSVTASATYSIQFAGSSANTIKSNGLTIDIPITFNGTGASWQLLDAFTGGANTTVTLSVGTLNLNNFSFTATTFSSNNSNARAIAFGTGQIYLTGSAATIWNSNNANNFTVTGTPVINTTYSGSTGTRTMANGAAGGGTEANSIAVNVTAGSDTLNIGNPFYSRGYNFTGFSGTLGTQIVNYYVFGNITFSSTMSLFVGSPWFIFPTNGTANITSNGITIDADIGAGNNTPDTPNCIVNFVDALNLGSTRTLNIRGGTVKLPASTTSTVGSLTTTGTALKYLRSTVSGTQATISDASGTNTVTYLDIKDSNATGGATFNATAATNVDSGNNTGWNFGVVIYTGTTNESFTVTDVQTLTAIFAGSLAETATLTDSQDALAFLAVSASETFTATDAQDVIALFLSDASESITLTDSTAGAQTSSSSLSESFTASDAQSVAAIFQSAQSETTTLTEASSFAYIAAGAITESMTLTEVQNFVSGIFASVSESVTLTESETASLLAIRSIAESFTNTDAQSVAAIFQSARAESTILTDAQAANFLLNAVLSESFTLTDLQNAIKLLASSIAESTTLNETQSALAVFLRDISESSTFTHTQTVQANFNAAASETTTLTDAQTVLKLLAAAIAESATLTDAQSAVQAYASAISEALSVAEQQLAAQTTSASVSESTTLTHAQTAISFWTAAVSESTTLTHVQTATAAFIASLQETLTATDSETATAKFNSAIAEAVTLTTAEAAFVSFLTTVNESTTLSDLETGIKAFVVSASETTTYLDTSSVLTIFNAIVDEPIGLTDTQINSAIFFAQLAEFALINDLNIGQAFHLVTLLAVESKQLAATTYVYGIAAYTEPSEIANEVLPYEIMVDAEVFYNESTKLYAEIAPYQISASVEVQYEIITT